jgi:predicted deacetylase
MLDAADTNHDGEIDKDEFVAWYGHARAKLEKAVEKLFRVGCPLSLGPWSQSI